MNYIIGGLISDTVDGIEFKQIKSSHFTFSSISSICLREDVAMDSMVERYASFISSGEMLGCVVGQAGFPWGAWSALKENQETSPAWEAVEEALLTATKEEGPCN